MKRKAKIKPEVKIKAVQDYLNGIKSVISICDELSVVKSTVLSWITLYRSQGESGLITKPNNLKYTKELKERAVKDYLEGKGSLWDISMKYKLRSKTQLESWIIKYNDHEEIKSSSIGVNRIMIKGRKTALEERIEIVKYCLENKKDYNNTCQKYQVSYQQVRNWVNKFEELGIDGLYDRRGKRKPKDQLSELEKLKAHNKLLESQNKYLEMENELLKKLEEIERR